VADADLGQTPPQAGNQTMIVCECTGTSDKKIRNLVHEGATTVAEITRRCGAGGCCRACRPLISRIVKATVAESTVAESAVAVSTIEAPAQTATA
jgi:bacterioferritin-associated ferredoxin